MPVFEGLGKALRWLREKQGRRQYEVAESARVTKAMLSAYETEKQRPSLETLERILDALGADLAVLGNALDLVNERVNERVSERAGERVGERGTGWLDPRGGDAVEGQIGRGGLDVSLLLGVASLPAEEELAMGQMLEGFHRFLRYLHTTREAQAGGGGGRS